MARQRGRQDSTNLWGVLGLAHTQSCGVFQDISNAHPRKTTYIQHHHFGAAFAFCWVAILGNRLKTVEYARRSSASIGQLSIAGTVARLFFSPKSTYRVLPITSAPDSQTRKDDGKARDIRLSHARISPLFPALNQRRQPDKPC